jgi:hypothetical protein
MARLNSNNGGDEGRGFQPWIIEDSWEGTIYLEARLVGTWQGLCGSNKILEDREGHFYWWVILVAPETGRALQRLVTFLDWDSIATELGIGESWGQDYGAGVNTLH